MNSEDKFKQSLKELLDEKEFAFSESDWESARAVIDAGKARKRRSLYLVSSAIVLTLALITYSLIPGEQATSKNLVVARNAPSKEYNSPVDSKEQIVELKNSVSPIATVKPHEKLNVQPLNENTSSEPIKSNEKPAVPSTAPSSVKIKAAPSESLVRAAEVDTKETERQVNAPAPAIETKPEQIKAESVLTTNNTPVQTKEPETKEEPNVASLVIAETTPTQVSVNLNPVVSEPVPSVTKSHTEPLPLKAEPGQDAKLPEQSAQVTVPESVVAPQETLVTQAPAAQNVETPDSAKTKPEIEPTNILFVEAGAFANNGWKTPAGQEGRGISPSFGLFFTNKLTPKIAVSFGAQYNAVGELGYSSKVAKQTHYGVGEYSYVTVITPKTAHYISIPLKLHYTVDAKDVVGLGYNVGYLLNVDSKVETYTQALTSVEGYRTYNTGGYTEGFKLFNSQLTVFYRRSLLKNLWVNAEIDYGISDLKEDAFFNAKIVERNSGFKLSLIYSFFKK